MRSIQAHSGQSLADLDIGQLREQVLQDRVLVLRGFAALNSQEYIDYASGSWRRATARNATYFLTQQMGGDLRRRGLQNA